MHILKDKKTFVLFILSGFFIANTVVAEMIGSKLINFGGPFVNSVGLILWPFVFLLTDILNEYYGKEVVRRLSFVTVGLIGYVYLVLLVTRSIPAIEGSPVKDVSYNNVFGSGMYMIIASIIAFIISQLLDSFMFWVIRKQTGEKMMWLRSTGSTLVSQLIDTFLIQFIAFVIPGYWTLQEFFRNAAFGYCLKVILALLLIPAIWALHKILDKYFGEGRAHKIIEKSAEESIRDYE
jgi:hypothetical protein